MKGSSSGTSCVLTSRVYLNHHSKTCLPYQGPLKIPNPTSTQIPEGLLLPIPPSWSPHWLEKVPLLC